MYILTYMCICVKNPNWGSVPGPQRVPVLAGGSSSSCLDELSISGVWPLECGFSRILEKQHCAESFSLVPSPSWEGGGHCGQSWLAPLTEFTGLINTQVALAPAKLERTS